MPVLFRQHPSVAQHSRAVSRTAFPSDDALLRSGTAGACVAEKNTNRRRRPVLALLTCHTQCAGAGLALSHVRCCGLRIVPRVSAARVRAEGRRQYVILFSPPARVWLYTRAVRGLPPRPCHCTKPTKFLQKDGAARTGCAQQPPRRRVAQALLAVCLPPGPVGEATYSLRGAPAVVRCVLIWREFMNRCAAVTVWCASCVPFTKSVCT